MPPTLVSIAMGALIGCALLGRAFDRRSIVVVTLAAALPDLDAVLALAYAGATNAVLHTLVVPAIAAGLLYWDTDRRQDSVVRTRWGAKGVRVAWVAIASYLIAGIGLDLFTVEGVALLYPFSDAVYGVSGKLVFSTQDGLVHTYLRPGSDGILPLWHLGTVDEHRIPTWIDSVPGGTERRIGLVDFGYHLVIVVTALATLLARVIVEQRWPAEIDHPGDETVGGR